MHDHWHVVAERGGEPSPAGTLLDAMSHAAEALSSLAHDEYVTINDHIRAKRYEEACMCFNRWQELTALRELAIVAGEHEQGPPAIRTAAEINERSPSGFSIRRCAGYGCAA